MVTMTLKETAKNSNRWRCQKFKL